MRAIFVDERDQIFSQHRSGEIEALHKQSNSSRRRVVFYCDFGEGSDDDGGIGVSAGAGADTAGGTGAVVGATAGAGAGINAGAGTGAVAAAGDGPVGAVVAVGFFFGAGFLVVRFFVGFLTGFVGGGVGVRSTDTGFG